MKGNKVPHVLLKVVIDAIASNTIEQLIPIITEARNKAANNELKNLLNPEVLELEFGKRIRINILETIKQKGLHLLTRDDLPSCVVQ